MRILVLIVLLGLGCSRSATIPPRDESVPSQLANEPPVAIGPAELGEWPFRPDAMRVHPLTRIRLGPEGEPLIEVWVEFTDRWEDSTKALGRLEIDLYSLDGQEETFITQWLVDLRSLVVNDTHWDKVTRMYLFRLEPESGTDLIIPARARIRGLFLSDHGLTMDGAVDVTPRGGAATVVDP